MEAKHCGTISSDFSTNRTVPLVGHDLYVTMGYRLVACIVMGYLVVVYTALGYMVI